MSTFKNAAIPPEVLALINNPPLLKGESSQAYYDLLSVLVSDVAPVDIVEWLWLIQFNDCTWEIFRNRRFRAILIDLQRNKALGSVILKTSPSGTMNAIQYNQALVRWKEDPNQFNKHGIDPQSVSAMAFVQAAALLEHCDKSLERLYRRCDSILQQLEYRREVFAHRARRVADNVLKPENVEAPKIAPAAKPLSLEPSDRARPDQSSVAPNEIPIVPTSSESDMAPSDESSPEASQPTHLSDTADKD
jgi:hypothetical protein